MSAHASDFDIDLIGRVDYSVLPPTTEPAPGTQGRGPSHVQSERAMRHRRQYRQTGAPRVITCADCPATYICRNPGRAPARCPTCRAEYERRRKNERQRRCDAKRRGTQRGEQRGAA